MARRWVQKELPKVARDETLRGGKRKGAGRKRVAARPQVPHRMRAEIDARTPVHVTMRLAADLGTLRRGRAYRAIRRATIVAARERDAAIVHISIQANHLHLLVEADDAAKLGEGMRRFAISAAKQLNAVVGRERGTKRSGRAFVDRYHATPITSPKQARGALAYVLNNWRRHHEHRRSAAATWMIDRYSSAIAFRGWAELGTEHAWEMPPDFKPLAVSAPTTWLLRIGWRLRGGGPIAMRATPGPCPAAA
jgi:REP element-mobilizing transposase RayT